MTPSEKQGIGIDRMSGQEKKLLNEFLVDAISMAYKSGQGSCNTESVKTSPPNAGENGQVRYLTGGGHWISENGMGKIITLEDSSLWEINSLDQVETGLWLPVTNITVMLDPYPVGDYKYILVNKDDGEKAHAKFLGREYWP